jgi:hypothetical protein
LVALRRDVERVVAHRATDAQPANREAGKQGVFHLDQRVGANRTARGELVDRAGIRAPVDHHIDAVEPAIADTDIAVGDVAHVDRVIAGRATDKIEASRAPGIIARIDQIVTVIAKQIVVTVSAEKRIIAAQAGDRVITTKSLKQIARAIAGQIIVAFRTCEIRLAFFNDETVIVIRVGIVINREVIILKLYCGGAGKLDSGLCLGIREERSPIIEGHAILGVVGKVDPGLEISDELYREQVAQTKIQRID